MHNAMRLHGSANTEMNSMSCRNHFLLDLCGLFVLAAGSVSAQDIVCVDCHDDVALESPLHGRQSCTDCHSNITSVPHRQSDLDKLAGEQVCGQCHELDSKFTQSVHADFGCEGCHGSGHELAPASGADCAGCHRSVARQASRSIHQDVASCIDCHGDPHGVIPVQDLNSASSAIGQIKSCGSCHGSPPELIEGYLGSVHAKGLLASGLVSAPGCSDCHGDHGIQPSSNPRSNVSREKVPETCGTCHARLLATWLERSAHGIAWQEGDEQGPVCTTCHSSHEIVEPTTAAERHRFPEQCGGCHGPLYTSFRDSFHGKATDLGFMSSAICSDCHTPHANLPVHDPRSSVHPANLAETCGQCHANINAAFLTFDPHAEPSDRADNAKVFWVWLFMLGLLLGAFAFFGVHDSLWLQRTLVGTLRGEYKSGVSNNRRYVKRFSRIHVWTHIVIVLSFLLLAATGLPLKFHSTPWAQSLVNVFGGIETARYLHRFAAIVTFGYFLFHLGYVFFQTMIRKQRGFFWGPNSLVPQAQDFKDIWANFKYFLYLGPRPRLGRWTYWEKFDYLAVFWGVAIIGLSGLIVWLPNFFTQFLPGWTLNAAYIVHSEEALLAAVFIFIFHFFHTHLRPEIFPMDPVVFLGRLPLERFKEERPIEYQRLVDAGELDAHLVDPPTRSETRWAYLFGFTAVAIGLLLAIGVFRGLIRSGLG
jgi:cytochrome b subunit of formate dehydrogenase